jgi:spermidine synthase
MGSLYEEKNKRMFVFSELVLLGLILIFFVWNGFLRGELHQIYFLGYCFTFSFFCGFQFPLAAKMIGERQSPAAGCLAADLAGAAVGTLVVGTLLIPLWGIQSAIFFLIFVKISSNMIMLFSKV